MPRTPSPESSLVDDIASRCVAENVASYQKFVAVRSFALAHTGRLLDSGLVDPAHLERSVITQIAYAMKVSPFVAKQKFRIARDLHLGLDHLRTLFAAGAVCERRASAIVTACAHLSPEERALVDARLADHDLAALGVGRIADLATKTAAEVAPEAFADRCAAAKSGRRVTLRPATDGMVDLKAHLPLVEGVAAYAALRKAANDAAVSPDPETRTPDQIMADTLVERVTGKSVAGDVDVEVQIVVPVEALLDPTSPLPAEVIGYGPVPADLLASSEGRKAYRRLFSSDGVIVGGESRQRTFTGLLASLIRTRDGGRCTEPYCDAPIRHTDHITRWADGGTTTFDNGRGLCVFHNHVRESSGWTVRRDGDTVTTTTPTGHEYQARIGTTAERPGKQRKRKPSDRVPSRVRSPDRP